MIFVNPIFTSLLSETEFYIEYTYIGNFYKDFSHLNINEKNVILEHTPFLLNDRSNYILLNDSDEILINSIKSLKFNYKILSAKVTKTNLSKKELKDIFKLIDIKNKPHSNSEKIINNLIIQENYALNHLCKSKQKQLGYINKNLLNQKFSSQTLSRINKKIDLDLCRKTINERGLFEVEESDLKEVLKTVKENSPKLFLFEIISNSKGLDINSIKDIQLICEYIKQNSLTKPLNLSLMTNFFSVLSEKTKAPSPVKWLFDLILEIEKKKKENIEDYNFFIDSWDKEEDKKTILSYFLNRIESIHEL